MANFGRRMTMGSSAVEQDTLGRKSNVTKNEKLLLEQILENYFKCSICLEVFNEPYELSCGHMYCFKCYEDWTRLREPTCPLCRRIINSDPVKCEVIGKLIADMMKHCRPQNRTTRSIGAERLQAIERKPAVPACKRPAWR